MTSITPSASSTAERSANRASLSSSDTNKTTDHLVDSLCEFLRSWTTTTAAQQREGDLAVSAMTSAKYVTQFPPPLPSPLPRSFRPCEMGPAVYLGSWQDIGTDMAALIQRLLQATTTTTTGTPDSTINASTDTAAHNPQQQQQQPSTKAAAPAAVATRAPHRMAVLVRACPLPGVAVPQLELHAARARKSGSRRATLGGAFTVGQRAVRPAPVAHPVGVAGVGTDVAVSVHDIEVAHFSLADLHHRVCGAAAKNSRSTESSSAASRAALERWLSPEPPTTCLTRARSGAVPADFSSFDWTAVVYAMQDILLGDYTAAVAACVPPTWREPILYWRLVVPVLDSPAERIQHYFAMTTLILHAALTMAAHPGYATWVMAGTADAVTVAAAAAAPTAGANTLLASEGVAQTSERSDSHDGGSGAAMRRCTASTAPVALEHAAPCVVVHCMAGKSRSVSFVAALLLQEWMVWYRVAHSPGEATRAVREVACASEYKGSPPANADHSVTAAMAASDTSVVAPVKQTRQTRQGTTARRLVDTVMAHLRKRRLCINVNLGFDAQLYAMVNAFVASDTKEL